MKLNIYKLEIKFTSHKRYLFRRLCSIKAKKTHPDQNTLQVLLLCSNQNDSQSFKSSSCSVYVCVIYMHVFSSVYVIDATCFNECFLFHVIFGKHFLQKFVATLRFCQPPYCCFIWNKCFERSRILRYFYSAVLWCQCCKNKAIVY